VAEGLVLTYGWSLTIQNVLPSFAEVTVRALFIVRQCVADRPDSYKWRMSFDVLGFSVVASCDGLADRPGRSYCLCAALISVATAKRVASVKAEWLSITTRAIKLFANTVGTFVLAQRDAGRMSHFGWSDSCSGGVAWLWLCTRALFLPLCARTVAQVC